MAEKGKGLSFHSRSVRAGGYSVLASLLVLALAVVVNLTAAGIPSRYTKLDLSGDKLLELSEETETMVSSLDKEVTVYWISQQGSEDAALGELLNRYGDLSKNLKVVVKDPVVYPNFASQYTSKTIYNNSLVVECGEKSRYIGYDSIYQTDYNDYYTTGSYTTSFYGETELTSAIQYVTGEDFPKLYLLSGHGEPSLDSGALSAVQSRNMDIETISLMNYDAIPGDAACVMIYAPASDISSKEKEMLLSYLQSGGNLLLFTDYSGEELSNLAEVAAYYGMTAADGIVLEGDANYCIQGYPHYLLPEIQSHEITSPLVSGGYYILYPFAQGIITDGELRDTLTVSSLLTTSDAAYSKTAGYAMETIDKEEGDLDGPFTLAAAAYEETEEGIISRVVWYTTTELLNSDNDEVVSGANSDLFLNTLSWICETEEGIAIHAKVLSNESLTVTGAQGYMLSLLVTVAVPAIFFGAGLIVFFKRRKR